MNEQNYVHQTKRCPDCFTKLPLDAVQCPECKQKIGEADKNGLAKKPINWRAYLNVVLVWSALIFYIWWAFFKN